MRTSILLIALAVTGPASAQQKADGIVGLNAPVKEKLVDTDQHSNVAITPAAKATLAYNSALDRLAAGDAHGAIKDMEEVLVVEPRDAYALLGRAEAYAAIGQKERARMDLWNALGIQPRGPVAERSIMRLGEFALEEGDLRSAEILFDRYVKIAPYEALAWCSRGSVRTALRQNEAALEDLDKALELDPHLDKAHVNKAIIQLRMGFRQEGCASLQLAHDLGDLSTEELLLMHCGR